MMRRGEDLRKKILDETKRRAVIDDRHEEDKSVQAPGPGPTGPLPRGIILLFIPELIPAATMTMNDDDDDGDEVDVFRDLFKK